MLRTKSNHERQQGAALLLIVIACVLGSIVVVAMLVRQRTNIEQAERYFAFVQGNQYAMGAEFLARQILYDALAASNNSNAPNNSGDSDNLQQAWNAPEVKFEDKHLMVAMSIEDMQGRFNLNSLAANTNTAQADTFRRLLASLDIIPTIDIVKYLGHPVGSTPAVPIPGAPTVLVSPASPPAPTANPPAPSIGSPAVPAKTLADPTQLLEQALSTDDYEKLRPFITTLPADVTVINVNTASETLLKAAIPNETQLRTILDRRAKKQSMISSDLQRAGFSPGTAVDVKSHFFQADITVTYQGKHYTWRSVIRRQKAKDNTITVETISRAFNREDNILK